MPRKRRVIHRQVIPDAKFNNKTIALFINKLMLKGKKSVATRIFYSTLSFIQERFKEDPLTVLNRAVENVRPLLEVKSRRVGGATYQVPVEVRPERSLALAIRWIIGFAKERNGKSMEEKLASEIIDASKKEGGAVKKREDTHKMAEANKAFAHYRW